MGNKQEKKPLSKIVKGIIYTVVGILLVIPFTIDSFILGHEYHYIHFIPMMYLLAFLVGIAFMIVGIINMLVRNTVGHVSASTVESDINRLRFTAETQAIINNNKPQGK